MEMPTPLQYKFCIHHWPRCYSIAYVDLFFRNHSYCNYRSEIFFLYLIKQMFQMRVADLNEMYNLLPERLFLRRCYTRRTWTQIIFGPHLLL